jgi:uncharacterized membrane protein
MAAFLVHFASLFALAVWVGGGVAIGFVVAPAVFEHAPSRKDAGELLGHVLRRFDRYVFVAGPIALLSIYVELSATQGAARTLVLKLSLVAAMLALAVYARIALARHGVRVLCLLGQLLLGAFAMALGVMTLPSRPG